MSKNRITALCVAFSIICSFACEDRKEEYPDIRIGKEKNVDELSLNKQRKIHRQRGELANSRCANEHGHAKGERIAGGRNVCHCPLARQACTAENQRDFPRIGHKPSHCSTPS